MYQNQRSDVLYRCESQLHEIGLPLRVWTAQSGRMARPESVTLGIPVPTQGHATPQGPLRLFFGPERFESRLVKGGGVQRHTKRLSAHPFETAKDKGGLAALRDEHLVRLGLALLRRRQHPGCHFGSRSRTRRAAPSSDFLTTSLCRPSRPAPTTSGCVVPSPMARAARRRPCA